MPRFPYRIAIVSILGFFTLFLNHARADWPPVSKEELEYKSVPGLPDAPAVILFHEEIDDDVLHFHQVYYRIKILTEAGRKYADVQIEYDKNGYNVSDVKARTTRPDGTTQNFEGKPLDKEVVKGQGYKYHVKTVTLPDVQVGSVIEYVYSWRYGDNWVVPPTWVLQNDLYQKKAHFKFTPTIHMDWLVDENDEPTTGLAWVAHLPQGSEIKSFRDQYYELTLSDVPPFLEEAYMPPATFFKYHANFYYRYSTHKEDFWKGKGKGWNKRIEKFMGKDKGIREQATSLVAAEDTPEQKARKIYTFVQTLQNTSYLPERNSEELKAAGLKEVVGVEDVLRQKRGNRDEITLLFIALCRAAGVPAHAMWVTDRGQTIFSDMYLSTTQLDDYIAYVTLDGKEKALDPGTKFAPFGLINWRYTASAGLKQTAEGKVAIAESPLPTIGGDAIQRQGSFLISDQGDAKGQLLVAFHGQEALSRRIRASRTDAAGAKKILEDEVKEWLAANSEVEMLKDPNWDQYDKPLQTVFRISTPVLTRAGKRLMLAPDFFVANRPAMFPHAERSQLVYFHHTQRELDNITITLPSTLEVESLPPVSQVETGYAAYKSERVQSQKTITVKRELQLGGIAFPAKDYPALKGFYDKVKEGDDQAVLLRSAAHAQVQ